MRRCNVAFALLVIVIATALGWSALQPVDISRGRDEVDFLRLEAMPLAAGASVLQTVPLSEEGLTAIWVPYRISGPAPGRLRATVLEGNAVLAERVFALAPTPPPPPALWFSNSYWHAAGASQLRVELSELPRGGQVDLLLMHEADGAAMELFVADSVRQLRDGRVARRPPLAGRSDKSLALQTAYGGSLPLVAKLPTYLQRMATLAPPWLPAPFIAMLAAAFALLGLALTVMSWRDDPGDEPSDGQSRAVSPQTLASTHGGGRE